MMFTQATDAFVKALPGKEVDYVSEKGKEILETFEKVIPELSEIEKEKLLSFGEGIAFMKNQQKCEMQKETG